MLITGREAARRLRESLGLHRARAELLLRAGLAGAAVRAGAAHLYDDGVIAELAARDRIETAELAARCPRGPFIGRIGARRGFTVNMSWGEQSAALAEWYVTIFTRVWMVDRDGAVRFPFIATLSDFVVFGADIVDWHTGTRIPRAANRREHLTRLRLEPPGPWFGGLEGRRLSLGPGHSYFVRDGPVSGPFPPSTVERAQA